MSSSYVFISEDELEALEGLPHIVYRLYISLKYHMDFQTGIVGHPRRISWMTLRTMLHVEEFQGFEDTGTPTRGKVTRAMEWLKKRGLVQDLGTKQRGEAIVFRLALAPLGQSVKNKPGQNPDRTRTGYPEQNRTQNNQVKSSTYAKNNKKPVLNPDSEKPKKPDDTINQYSTGDINIPPLKTTLSNPHTKTAPSAQVERVFEHWQSMMKKPLAKLDAKRKSRIEWALKTYGLVSSLEAIDGCQRSEWHMGANDRHREFNDLTLIFRDAEHTERFLSKPTGRKSGIKEWLAEDECIEGEVVNMSIATGGAL